MGVRLRMAEMLDMTVAKRSIRLGVRLRPLQRPPLCGSGGQVADFGETAFPCPLTR